MQNANSTDQQRVNRRKSTTSAVTLQAPSNVSSQNQTINYFLGANVVNHRPWMTATTTAPAAHSANVLHGSSASRSVLTSRPSPPQSTSTVDNGTTQVISSSTTNPSPLPSYRFVSVPPTSSYNEPTLPQPEDLQIARTDGVADQDLSAEKGGQTVQGKAATTQEVEVLDLILDTLRESSRDRDTSQSVNAPLEVPQQPATTSTVTFPELPTLELNAASDLITTEPAVPYPSVASVSAAQQLVRSSTVAAPGVPSTIHGVLQQPPPQPTTRPLANVMTSTLPSNATPSSGTNVISSVGLSSPPTSVTQGSYQPWIHHGQHNSMRAQQSFSSDPVAPSHIRTQSLPYQPNSQLPTPDRSPLTHYNQGPDPMHNQLISLTYPTPQSRFANPVPLPVSRPHYHYSAQAPYRYGASSNTHVALVRPFNNTSTTNPIQTRGQGFLSILKANIQRIASNSDINCKEWNSRFPSLVDACECDDFFFVHLHQLFCIWSVDQTLARHLGLDPSCDTGFNILALLFGANSALHKQLLEYLATWPQPLSMVKSNPHLQNLTSAVRTFLPTLDSKWHNLRRFCLNQKMPPAFTEISRSVSYPRSPVLSGAIFCSILRLIHSHGPPGLHSAVYELFKHNARESDIEQVDVEITKFKTAYLSLCNQAFQSPTLTEAQRHEIRSVLAGNVCRAQDQDSTSVQSSSSVARPLSGIAPTNSKAPFINSQLSGIHHPSTSLPPARQGPPYGTLSSAAPAQRHEHPQAVSGAMRFSYSGATSHNAQHQNNQAAILSHRKSLTLDRRHAPAAAQRLLPIDRHHLPDIVVDPNTVQEALHQVSLHQPTVELRDHITGDRNLLYQYIDGFVLEPHAWSPASKLIVVNFDLSSVLFQKRCVMEQQSLGPFRVPRRIIRPHSVLFNLRCVSLSNYHIEDDLRSYWAASQSYWPQHIFISINGEHLDIRRKRQHKRDLPVDVTSFVKADQNEIKISIHPEPGEYNKMFGIAVEIIGFHNHSEALQMPSTISAEKSLQTMTAPTARAENVEDEDIMLIDDSMTVSITDPFSSRMFNIPARGNHCKHRECFDLETFLNSRQSDHSDVLSSVYGWQCPICRADARPCSLVIDGFFQHVRNTLAEMGEMEARAITVKADGSWTVKKETEETSVSNRKSSAPPVNQQNNQHKNETTSSGNILPHNGPRANSTATTRMPEVIVLD